MNFRSITKSTTIGIVACLLLVAPAVSAEDSEFSRSGFYVGANVIGASYLELDQIDNDLESDPTVGFGLLAGYRLNPGLALEAQFEMLPTTDVDLDGSGTIGDLSMWTMTGNLKIFLWPERFQPYVLMGMGGMTASSDDQTALNVGGDETAFTLRFGAGLDFYITKNIVASVGANYLLPANQKLEDYDYVSYGGGIQYRF